jgi:tetratricopeptide (TPR) repeat protein
LKPLYGASKLEAIKINSINQYFYFNLANTFFALKNFLLAITYYRKSLDIDPLYSDALFNLGNAHAELMESDTALFYFNKVSNFNINIRKCLTRAVPHPNRVATPKTTIRNCVRKTQSTEALVYVSTPSVPSAL